MIAPPPGCLDWTVRVNPSIANPTWFEVEYLVSKPYSHWKWAGAFPTFRLAAETARLVKWTLR